MKTHTKVVIGLIAAASMFAAGGARAGAVIFNGGGTAATSSLALGVNDFGNLITQTGNVAVNADETGLAYKFNDGQFRDGISPAADAEGWGISTSSNGGHSGFANTATDGVVNLTLGTFVAASSIATSIVSLTSLPGLSVSHAYTPAAGAPGALFQAVVTIRNTSGTALNDVKYVRVVDWDVPPTEFNELVTIHGTATTTMLERSHDGGFSSADPLGGAEILFDPATVNVDFTDFGPADHGAYFRFNFGTLAADDEIQFSIFYGATASERTALAAFAADGIELFSLGQSSPPSGDPILGTPVTYILGFRDVGNAAEPPQIPTPGALALLGIGLAGLAWSRRNK
jgi:hypothetical protein